MLHALSATLVGLSTGAEDVPARPGQFGVDTVVRHIVGVDQQRQILAIDDRIEPGMRLAFCTRDAKAARVDLVRIAMEMREELESGAAHGGPQ